MHTTIAREPRASTLPPVVQAWRERMPFVFDDGGRAAAGFKGKAGDCVARSIAIVSGMDYASVYAALAAGTGAQRATRRHPKRAASARNGVAVGREWFKRYMSDNGFRWVPAMAIGTGCRVHLARGELPAGRLVVRVARHCTAVIDGEIRDTFDAGRPRQFYDHNGQITTSWRCVYGWWVWEPAEQAQ